MPIIPLFIGDLGVNDPAAVAWWSGLIMSAASLALAVFAPLWGFLADRIGKRAMLLRALVAGFFVVGLMSVVTDPWQLLVLRILQGCLTGTVAAATVLLAGIVPAEAAGMALGMLTTVVFVGNSAGPLIGGLVADLANRRITFLATSLLLAASVAVLLRWVHEPPAAPRPQRPFFDFAPFKVMPALTGLLLVGLAIQCATSIIYPMLPLFVDSLGEHGGLVASTSGLILGVSALSAALSAMLAGRLGGRFGYAAVLQVCVAGGFLFSLPQAWVSHPAQLLVLRTLSSACLGGAMPMINALVATRIPRHQQGGVFGIGSSLNGAGAAIGPAIGSALAAGFGLASVFVGGAAVMALTGLAMVLGIRRLRGRTVGSHPRLLADEDEG